MLAKALQSAALATQPLYVEDVFSTYLYTGNGLTQTITNGIDLAGKGGLVWIKSRSAATNHFLFDTARGTTDEINSNTTDAEASLANSLTAFNADGFSISSATGIGVNAATYASWTFRKAPKFFDVVTYTGTGANRTVAHGLGSVPGCIIVKRTDTTGDWQVYHRANTANPETDYLVLNSTAATADSNTRWNDTLPTATEFSLGTEATVNASGGTYVAYLFAHDAGGFGDNGTENVISCGGVTADGSGNVSATNLGWEPQWVLYKRTDSTSNWFLFDTMRGLVTGTDPTSTNNQVLYPNLTNAEAASGSLFQPTATGFGAKTAAANSTWIYIAIRRGPMKTPTTGTEVFYPLAVAQADTLNTSTVPFPPDLVNTFSRNGTLRAADYNLFQFADRLRGLGLPSDVFGNPEARGLVSSKTIAEYGSPTGGNTYICLRADGQNIGRSSGWNDPQYGNWINYFFRRAPGFFDVVCYTGTGVARTVAHNLGVAPELMIVKNRSDATGRAWAVYAGDATDYLVLNTTAATVDDIAYWNDTSPTSSVFTVGTSNSTNESSDTFVAYLFATLPGISKVGSYTGNGTSQTIDCGFTTGARFVLIKRTDNTGDWYVWDSARGIVAGNDPHLSLNTTAAEVTTDDSVDADTSGFIVNQDAATNVNVNSASYIFLAIA